MAFVAIDIDIAGQGVYDVGSMASMLFWECHLSSIGGLVRQPELTDLDHVLRAGFIAWGDSNDAIGGDSRIYWCAPHWLSWTDELYYPIASNFSGTPQTFLARWFRWSLSAGTSGHLYGYAL